LTELQLARSATRWMRRFGLAFVALVATTAFILGNLLAAQSTNDGADSEVDYALKFTGAGINGSGYLIPQQQEFSLEFWVKPETSQTDGILSQGSNGTNRYYLQWNSNGSVQVYSYLSSVSTPAGSVPRDSWTHVAITHNATATRIYLNGQEIASTGRLTSSGWGNSFRLGARYDGAFAFDGHKALPGVVVLPGTSILRVSPVGLPANT
jgi:hypothetical protein